MCSRKAKANEDEFVCTHNKSRRATETVKIKCEHRWMGPVVGKKGWVCRGEGRE